MFSTIISVWKTLRLKKLRVNFLPNLQLEFFVTENVPYGSAYTVKLFYNLNYLHSVFFALFLNEEQVYCFMIITLG